MKKECEIINDLLPNYVENLVSEETKKFVNEHISNCEQCKKQLEILREDRNKINLKSKDEQKIELDYLKKYNKKMIILKIILITIITLITISIAFSIYRYIYNSKVVENVERKISEITDLNNYHIYETQYYKFNQNNEENYYTTEIFYKDGKYKKIVRRRWGKTGTITGDRSTVESVVSRPDARNRQLYKRRRRKRGRAARCD